MKTIIFQPAKITIIVALAAVVALSGCHSSSKTTAPTQPATETAKDNTAKKPRKAAKVEDFDKFYDRFHTDSAFQMSRIKFPLGGGYHTLDNSTKWTAENWHIMTTRVYDVDKNKYKTTYSKTETTFTQKVWINQAGLFVECRFELIDGKWFLVYMNDENK